MNCFCLLPRLYILMQKRYWRNQLGTCYGLCFCRGGEEDADPVYLVHPKFLGCPVGDEYMNVYAFWWELNWLSCAWSLALLRWRGQWYWVHDDHPQDGVRGALGFANDEAHKAEPSSDQWENYFSRNIRCQLLSLLVICCFSASIQVSCQGVIERSREES